MLTYHRRGSDTEKIEQDQKDIAEYNRVSGWIGTIQDGLNNVIEPWKFK